MIYAGIDVNIITHERAMEAGVEAFGLWCWGMCWAQIHKSDGRLPRIMVLGALRGRRNIMLAARLVASGLWIAHEDGAWTIRNYSEKNQTSLEIAAKLAERRAANAARQRNFKRREALANAMVTLGNGPITTTPLPLQLPDQITEQTAPVAPSTDPATKVRSRGSRLPEGWKPSEDTQEWARREGIADPLGVLDEFADFWRAQPGARGVKLDWDATYRNRLRQVGARPAASRFAARGAEITKQPYDPNAPWLKLPEVG